jgi:hypothetical protein
VGAGEKVVGGGHPSLVAVHGAYLLTGFPIPEGKSGVQRGQAATGGGVTRAARSDR